MVTINTDVSKKVANGTMCHLHDIILDDNATIGVHITQDGTRMHSVYSHEIVFLLFHHRLSEFKSSHSFDSLPLGRKANEEK